MTSGGILKSLRRPLSVGRCIFFVWSNEKEQKYPSESSRQRAEQRTVLRVARWFQLLLQPLQKIELMSLLHKSQEYVV